MPKSKHKIKLLLDSGVFSAWNRGTSLDLNDYIKWLHDHEQLLWSYVAMDIIPGTFGERRTSKQVEDSAAGGYKNLQIMRDKGLSPIPVFHQGERMYWLERLLKDQEPYIGISTAKDLGIGEQSRWLDDVYSLITNAKGQPLVKIHGFGITNTKYLLRYPWYTVDSTTWSLTPGYGMIYIPVYENGQPNYRRPPVRIVISGVQHQSATWKKLQFEGMGQNTQEAILHFLNEVVGISITEARYGTGARRRAMLIFFREFAAHLVDVRFNHRRSSIHTSTAAQGMKPVKAHALQIVHATALSREWSHELNWAQANTRLLSYWELRKKPTKILEEYVTHGIVGGDYVKKPPKPNWSESHLNFRRLALAARLEQLDADGT